MADDLDVRKRGILKIIIDDYILTAEPVGSEAVSTRHRLGVSAATVRNEMAALEELGYLQQPHTSAGRVPTEHAYRVYVDSMLEEEQVPAVERTHIRRTLVAAEPERTIQQAARTLASVTNFAAVVAPVIGGEQFLAARQPKRLAGVAQLANRFLRFRRHVAQVWSLNFSFAPPIFNPNSRSETWQRANSATIRPSYITRMRSDSARISSNSEEISNTPVPSSRARTIRL